jgi:hypothetical protein
MITLTLTKRCRVRVAPGRPQAVTYRSGRNRGIAVISAAASAPMTITVALKHDPNCLVGRR